MKFRQYLTAEGLGETMVMYSKIYVGHVASLFEEIKGIGNIVSRYIWLSQRTLLKFVAFRTTSLVQTCLITLSISIYLDGYTEVMKVDYHTKPICDMYAGTSSATSLVGVILNHVAESYVLSCTNKQFLTVRVFPIQMSYRLSRIYIYSDNGTRSIVYPIATKHHMLENSWMGYLKRI